MPYTLVIVATLEKPILKLQPFLIYELLVNALFIDWLLHFKINLLTIHMTLNQLLVNS